jgi:hypothetical protein
MISQAVKTEAATKGLRTCLAVILITIAGVAASAAPAKTRHPSCAARGSHTVVQTRQVRVFRLKGETFGCLFQLGKKRPLGDTPGFPDSLVATNISVAGHFVGYQLKFIGRTGSSFNVRVLDLKLGRRVHNVRAGEFPFGDENPNVKDPGVTALAVTSTGAVAWIVRNSFADPVRLEVHKDDSDGPTLLDTGDGIDPASLAVSTSGVAYWLHADAPHSTQLR